MPQPPIPKIISYSCTIWGCKCLLNSSLTHHKKSMHPNISPPKEASQHKQIRHQYLTGTKPSTPDGSFLTEPVPNPEPVQPPDTTPKNPWAPFPDRLAFDWAQYHYVRLQSSADEIHEGLDIWHTTVIKHETEYGETDHVPWRSAQDLYETLDSIKAGGVS
ncbi:hypothetical protein L208DRAFT_1325431 [Tricholoma matsutake]|nr:hypothetical protein L208DRAFT_1325431 [Tricholoma matsutake 945]